VRYHSRPRMVVRRPRPGSPALDPGEASMIEQQEHGHRDDTELERRRQLRDRRTHDVVELISRRSELVGINPWADHVIESVAWTA
jgi:hypothetical protein